MKKVVWFAAGAAAGAGGTIYAGKKVKRAAQEAAEKLKPVNVAKSAAGSAGRAGRSVVDAIKEGRVAAAEREAQLKAERDAKLANPADAPAIAGIPLTGGPGQPPVQIVVVDARDADVLRGLDELRASRSGTRRTRRSGSSRPGAEPPAEWPAEPSASRRRSRR